MLETWRDQTVVCIASGPSLTADDCAVVRDSRHPTIVTNTTFQLCTWADVLYAFDRAWWKRYIEEVRAVFTGDKYCESPHVVRRDILCAPLVQGFVGFGNSGASAVSLGIAFGSRRLVMLGYDCQFTGGRAHHHGDHPEGLSNCESLARWPAKFARLARYAETKGAEVFNATRTTALNCFQRKPLAECL